MAKLSPEQLLDMIVHKEDYGLVPYPLFDVDSYTKEDLQDLLLKAALFVLADENKNLAIHVIADHAKKESSYYLQLASELQPEDIAQERPLSGRQEQQILNVMMTLAQETGIPFAMLTFLESQKTGETKTVLNVAEGIDARTIAKAVVTATHRRDEPGARKSPKSFLQ